MTGTNHRSFPHSAHRTVAAITLLLLGAAPVGADVQFQDEASSAGIAAAGESYGASWGDLNGDGYPDLFVSNHRTQPAVYVNRRDGTFYRNSNQVFPWVNRRGADTHGGTWSDFDNDGDLDLLITTGTGNAQQLLVNERGDLIDRTQELGVALTNAGGREAMWLDYDRDGLMDFIIIQWGGVAQLFNQTAVGFVNTTIGSNVVCNRIQYGHLLDIDRDGQLDIVCANDAQFPRRINSTRAYPLPNITWLFPKVAHVADSIVADFDNNGQVDAFFVSGTQLRTSGVSQPTANSMEALLSNGIKGFNFVSGGRISVQLDWNKTKGSNFTRIFIGANSKRLVNGMPFTLDNTNPDVWGVPPSDAANVPRLRIGYDTTQEPARWVFIAESVDASGTQKFSEAYLQVSGERPITDLQTSGLWPGDLGGVPTLMLNSGAAFADATAGSGLEQTVTCVSAVAGDFDNDMDVDLYLACREGAQNISNRYYDNDGTGRFSLVPDAGGAIGPVGTNVADMAGAADSVVVADYDVDGFLDLFVTNGFNLRPRYLGGPNNLFRNQGNGNNWLELDLVGTSATRDAVGAIVKFTANGVIQTRVVDGGYHRWSQNDHRIHVGLANATKVDIEITWPAGYLETYRDVAANAVYKATELSGLAPNPTSLGVPYACGKPAINAWVDTGVYVWKECYLGVWRVRFAAAGDKLNYRGSVAANAPIERVNNKGWGNVLNLDDPSTLVFDITEANAKLKGFNLIPGARATYHCLRLTVPAGTPIYYGPFKDRMLSNDINLESGTACSPLP
jgi:hypothetical protein